MEFAELHSYLPCGESAALQFGAMVIQSPLLCLFDSTLPKGKSS
jgi:hypothetical protein